MEKTVRKHEIDMLHGSIWNKLPLFALPVAATAILEQLFHASDVAIVGNFSGDACTVAVAAVGANGPIIGLIVNLFIGIALGANVVIATAIGCGDGKAVERAVFSFANIVIQSAINSLGTVVIAASSAAFNIEILAYDVLNSFSQACTTFVGQNYGAGQIKRCKKTMQLSLLEDAAATFLAVALVLLSARSLLAIFNGDPQVIDLGYVRLATILPAYGFCLLYEILSAYLRGFGISLTPALLTMLGVCGIRIAWVKFVFPQSMTFQAIMLVYPVSLGATALLILIATLILRPSRRYAHLESLQGDK